MAAIGSASTFCRLTVGPMFFFPVATLNRCLELFAKVERNLEPSCRVPTSITLSKQSCGLLQVLDFVGKLCDQVMHQ
jgi:hypothetical protein